MHMWERERERESTKTLSVPFHSHQSMLSHLWSHL